MGEVVGYVSRNRGSASLALDGLPAVQANPSQFNGFTAITASGIVIGTQFPGAREAQLGVENTVGLKLQWKLDRSDQNYERYIGSSPFLFPGDFDNEGGIWLRASSGARQVARASDPGVRFVPSWASQDGTPGRRFTQATDADQPTFAAEAINGRKAVQFDTATTEFMTSNISGQLGGPFSAFAVARYRDASRDQVLIQSDGGFAIRVTAAGVLEVDAGASTINGGSVTDGQVFALAVLMSATETSLYLDGQLVGVASDAASDGDWTLSDAADAWAGDIGEIYINPRLLTVVQALQLLDGYYNRTYDVYVPTPFVPVNPATPGELGAILWNNADQLVTLAGSEVAEWGDITGNQPPWLSPVRPELVAIDGKNYLRFLAANNEYMQLAPVTGVSNDWTFAVAINSNGNNGDIQQLLRAKTGITPLDGITLATPPNIGITETPFVLRDSGVPLVAGKQVIMWRLDSTTNLVEVYRSNPTSPDGTAFYSGTFAIESVTSYWLGQSGVGFQYMDGDLRDLSIFTSALDDGERAALFAYLTDQL